MGGKKSRKNHAKKNFKNSFEESSKAYMCLCFACDIKTLNLTNDSGHITNDQFRIINNSQIISLNYNSRLYEYDGINNMIIPVYLNLQGKTNKNIIDVFQAGFISEYMLKKI